MNEIKRTIDYLNLTAEEMERRAEMNKRNPELAGIFYKSDGDFASNSYKRMQNVVSGNAENEELKLAVINFNQSHKELCMDLAYDEQGNPIHEMQGERQ